MAREARQRTKGQRQSKPDGPVFDNNTIILDDEEQEAEINSLRKQNAAWVERMQNTLDIGVMTCLIICSAQLLRHLDLSSPFLTLLSVVQTLLLPLSLTPTWLPLFAPLMRKQHPVLVMTHLMIFVLAFNTVKKQGAGMGEILRWALPEIIAGAVEIQRRSEEESERKLGELDGLTYESKGP